ncbi:hypothetical protein FD754_023867 [Muntiacus muntjak]|uniref:Ig-like domain-containing protein n=1 Tax=Muntiacus muntjak TaxID=9888 RepID=A0A5N3URX2_MUNMU|nr:hypothetical protein FD754_023868 [Muntiacus muntjak]KAB0339505.1 hypothetical protein FD754_023867 [Muntiacus muntjak]
MFKRLCRQEFIVMAPPDPIVAVLGGEALLPCRVSPAMSAEDMELRWFRSKFSEAVFIYQDRLEQKEEQMAAYAGRTSLVRDLLNQGEAAVRIQNVDVSDNGLYTCFFRKGGFYEEANLELKVAGVGSAPQVHITGPEEDGVRVVCTTSGWFPKPQVQWRDLSGEKFLAFSEAHTQDAEGLFSVEAALVVRDSSVGNVTCSILNPVLGQEKAMDIFIPEPFFPQASPWKVAFLVSLTVLVILLLGAGCYTKREHSIKVREMGEKETLCQAREQDRQTKEEMLKDTAILQEELERRKSTYLAAWRKAQLYAGVSGEEGWQQETTVWKCRRDKIVSQRNGGKQIREDKTRKRKRGGDEEEWCKRDHKSQPWWFVGEHTEGVQVIWVHKVLCYALVVELPFFFPKASMEFGRSFLALGQLRKGSLYSSLVISGHCPGDTV